MAFNTRQHGKEQQLGLPRKSISMLKHKWWLSDLGACVWRASVVSDFTWGEEMGRRSGEGLISLFSPDLLRVEKQIGDLLPLHVHRYAVVRRERRRERRFEMERREEVGRWLIFVGWLHQGPRDSGRLGVAQQHEMGQLVCYMACFWFQASNNYWKA